MVVEPPLDAHYDRKPAAAGKSNKSCRGDVMLHCGDERQVVDVVITHVSSERGGRTHTAASATRAATEKQKKYNSFYVYSAFRNTKLP